MMGLLKNWRAKSSAELVFDQVLLESTPRLFVTPILISINTAIFIVTIFFGVPLVDPDGIQLLYWGANFGPFTLNEDWWRLISSIFLHFGILHLLFNMWCLWDLGRLAERMFGNWTFLGLYLFSGLGGNGASLWWHPTVISAGASGAVFGVVGGLTAFLLLGKLAVPRIVVKKYLYVVLAFTGFNLVYGLTTSGIDNAAHLGGFTVGLVVGALLNRPLPAPRSAARLRHYLVFGSIALAIITIFGIEKRVIDDPLVKLAAADKFLDSNKFDQAIVILEGVLQVAPDSAPALLNLGAAYLRKGLEQEAMRVFQQVIQLDPDADTLSKAHYNLGLVHAGKQRYEQATAAFDKALELEPEYAKAQYFLGVIYAETGRYDESLAALQRVIELGELDANLMANAFYNMGSIYRDRELYDQAIAAFNKAIEHAPESSSVYGELGWVNYLKGNFTKCIEFSENAIALKPSALYARYNIPLCYLRLGEIEKAKALYLEARNLDEALNEGSYKGAIQDLIDLIQRGIMAEEADMILRDVFGWRAPRVRSSLDFKPQKIPFLA